ncbi:GGDEF domain-containing protein [Streptomyces sp. NPDC004647]|uniref:GGDEF domain-containing protein n=1 Tax=Streptomyces sp. NPDC004647 TaxID=3154671 RepID=UPI0033AF5227
MPSWTDHLRFAFQPVVNLTTGSVAALEILARPERGDVLTQARRNPDLDGELAALAVRSATRLETLLPLHVNVFAGTAADLGGLASLGKAVRDSGRLPWEVTVDLGAPFTHVPWPALLSAVASLRDQGFRICADGVGDGDLPLRLLAGLSPDLVKVDASVVARLPEDPGYRAVVAGLRRFCDDSGGQLSVEGVETELQYAAARETGAQLAQGDLFAPAARLPAADVYRPAPPPSVPAGPSGPTRPLVLEFLHPAALLPVSASAGDVRALLTASPEVSGVVLVDSAGAPVRTVDRDRFLLSLSGRYGHALYADRPAVRLADLPRTVGTHATAWQVLDVVAADERSRTGDDVTVVDGKGRCVGVVHLADIVRVLAENRVEEAARLNPLTRLPGSDAVNSEVDRRIADGREFALSWLDVDGFKQVNDGAGFAAGDELIRAVGRTLAEAAAGRQTSRVGHIGGDDFLLLADPDALEPLASAALDAPWSVAGIPVTMSLATVLCPPGSVADHHQAAACLAPLKKRAKALRGASWVLGRPGSLRHEVRRGTLARVPGPGSAAGATGAVRGVPAPG